MHASSRLSFLSVVQGDNGALRTRVCACVRRLSFVSLVQAVTIRRFDLVEDAGGGKRSICVSACLDPLF